MPIDKRKNLLTGEFIETVQGEGEPQWQKVTQYMKFEKPYSLMLVDILKSDKVEKRCVVIFYINPSSNSFKASYAESFGKKYAFRVELLYKAIKDDDKYGGEIGSTYSFGYNKFAFNDKGQSYLFEASMSKEGEFPNLESVYWCRFSKTTKSIDLNESLLGMRFNIEMYLDKGFSGYVYGNKKFAKVYFSKGKELKNFNPETNLLEVFKNDN